MSFCENSSSKRNFSIFLLKDFFSFTYHKIFLICEVAESDFTDFMKLTYLESIAFQCPR